MGSGQVENQIIDVLLELLKHQSDHMRVRIETPWYYC
jgi:hypothetical protein